MEHRAAEHTAADTAADTEAVHKEPEDTAAADTGLEDTDLEAVQDTAPAAEEDIDPEEGLRKAVEGDSLVEGEDIGHSLAAENL